MENDHHCAGGTLRSLFCGQCGKVLDKNALRSVKFQGFIGTQSLSPAMQTFWETGDPAVFSAPTAA